jgi:hypothetical protein
VGLGAAVCWSGGRWGRGRWGWKRGALGRGALGLGLADDFDGAYVALADAQNEEAAVQQVVRAGNRVL